MRASGHRPPLWRRADVPSCARSGPPSPRRRDSATSASTPSARTSRSSASSTTTPCSRPTPSKRCSVSWAASGPDVAGAAFNMANHPPLDWPFLKRTRLVGASRPLLRPRRRGHGLRLPDDDRTGRRDGLDRLAAERGLGLAARRSSPHAASTNGSTATAISRISISAIASGDRPSWPSSRRPATFTCRRPAAAAGDTPSG